MTQESEMEQWARARVNVVVVAVAFLVQLERDLVVEVVARVDR